MKKGLTRALWASALTSRIPQHSRFREAANLGLLRISTGQSNHRDGPTYVAGQLQLR